MSKETGMTYAGSGVNYDPVDLFKKECQRCAKYTASNAERLFACGIEESRGESAYLTSIYGRIFGHVEEGLGTKNLVADAMRKITGSTYYGAIAQDTVAMIVNDLATLGVFPVSLAMHVAVANADWFKDTARIVDLAEGFEAACHLARCIWGPGETPVLKGIIMPDTALLSGSAIGVAKNRSIDSGNIQDNDVMIFLESSGIHANGLTLTRDLAQREMQLSGWRKLLCYILLMKYSVKVLPQGYATWLYDNKWLSGNKMYGEALLEPTHIYSDFVEDCLDAGVDIHYAVNITGHGWRKLMRASQSFAYIVEKLPLQLPIFDFIQKHGRVSDEEMYSNFNMGAGFALYVSKEDVEKVLQMGKRYKDRGRYGAMVAGHIESGEKKVVILPKGLEFAADTLKIR